jgi:hypothetical protein
MRIAWRSAIAGLIRGAVDPDQLVEIERARAAIAPCTYVG